VKCQDGSKYHKDISQKNCHNTQSRWKNISTTTEYCDSANRVKKDVNLAWGSSLQYRQDTIQIESPLSLVNKRQSLTYVSHNDDDQYLVCSDIVNCR